MVLLPIVDVGLLPYPKRTDQSLTHTQPIDELTNHKPTSHMSTNPNTTTHVSTNPNLPVTLQPITSQPIKNQPITYRPTPAQSTNSNAWPCLVLSGGSRQRNGERGRHINGWHALRQVVGQGAPSRGRRRASGVRSQVPEDSSKPGRGARKKTKKTTSRYLFLKP